MDNEKPKCLKEYKEWLERDHQVKVTKRTETYYESVTAKVFRDYAKSDFWTSLIKNLGEFDSEYKSQTKYDLLLTEKDKPELHIKSFDSFLLKTFRKNVLLNENWPYKPEGGWILPDKWYSRINDIIRTLVTVRYLDGVEFLIEKMSGLCERYNLPFKVSYEAKEEGYYAAHFYTHQEFEIPGPMWDTEKTEVSIEIQITTQLQEVIRRLLHKYYEEKRQQAREEYRKWQWDYKSDEFVANYLGHILHYIEGMIMDVREKQQGGIT